MLEIGSTLAIVMLDAAFRPFIDKLIDPAGRRLAALGVTANQMTVAGFLFGALAAGAIAQGHVLGGLGLIALNRLCDGLDGAIARATELTDFGAFLDLVLDFVFYALVPLAFAIAAPERNALPAAMLLASFLANGSAFFAWAALAERRHLMPRTQGLKSLYYVAGLAEGFETIVAFAAMCLLPTHFPAIALAFAALCTVSAIGRIAMAARDFL